MKILIFSGKLTGGGAERVAVNMADGLSKKGHDVVLCCESTGEKTYQPSDSVKLIFYPTANNRCHISKINVIVRILNMRKIIKKFKPNVIIGICGETTCLAKIAQIFSFKRIPIIYSEHNTLERPDSAPLDKKDKFLKFIFSKYCDAYTVLTYADKKYGETKCLKNIITMPNPLFFKPLSEIPRKEKIILANGRLDAWHVKGFDLLIEAWSLISYKYPDWKLQILGSGTENDKNNILHFAKINNVVNRIELLGYTTDVIYYYQKAEIFVLSSRYEGFGLVLTEAMSQACACVAADYMGRQGEIITDGVDGLLCQTDNAEDLAIKIELLIKDDNLRKKFQITALNNLDRFSMETYANRWNKLINNIV